MRCPRDGAELESQEVEGGVEIDRCPTCGGTFLDHGELELLQAAVEKDHRAKHLAPAAPVDSMHEEFEAERQEALPLVDCPKCSRQMERRRYGLGSQTVIDTCPDGDLWLDRGELDQLERFYERSHDEVEIPITWRIWAAVRGSLRAK